MQVLAEKLPDVLDFPKDLVNLEGSTKVLNLIKLKDIIIVRLNLISKQEKNDGVLADFKFDNICVWLLTPIASREVVHHPVIIWMIMGGIDTSMEYKYDLSSCR